MRNQLALKIKPTIYHDKIESDVITMAVEAGKFSNLHAWCSNEDSHMIISNKLMPLKLAQKYCQGDD